MSAISTRYLLAVLSLAVCDAFLAPPAAADKIDIDVFVDALSPHGQWIDTPQHGRGWVPANIPPDWRPYTDGRWAWTDEYGWTWVSDHEWGWAPFHYGRWYSDPRLGWVWVPGTEWAPAWVAWRSDDSHVGWAPLPPQVRWTGTAPLRLRNVDIDDLIDHAAWVFTGRQSFVQPQLRRYILPVPRSIELIPATRDITYYAPVEFGIANRSLNLRPFAKTVGSVPRLPVVRINDPVEWKARRGDKSRLYLYQPGISSAKGKKARSAIGRDAKGAKKNSKAKPPYGKQPASSESKWKKDSSGRGNAKAWGKTPQKGAGKGKGGPQR